MVKFLIGLVILLAICVAAGVIRKLRGGNLLPPPETIDDGKPEPQSLKELAERRRAEKQQR
jgi:hypothetical protein